MLDRIAAPAIALREPMAVTAGAVLLVLASGMSASAQQQPQPESHPQPPAAAQAEQPKANPGLFEEIGKLFKDSTSGFKSLPSPGETLDGLSAGTKDATDSLKRLAPSLGGQSVSGRALCAEAGNGAPDCKSAADQICREKGLGEGRTVDIESAHKCSAKAFLTGKTACRTEYFVTRAVCQ